MQISPKKIVDRRAVGDNIWLRFSEARSGIAVYDKAFDFTVLETEDAVGQAMFDELEACAGRKTEDIVIVILGGRGAQAFHRILGEKARGNEIDTLLGRLHVFTQDALAPMRMNNALSFVRDFERILGEDFFRKVKSFTSMNTASEDLEGSLTDYIEKLDSLGGIDVFYLGFGPESEAASHLCYIKPGAGAKLCDFAGIIPISPSILEHHITKFRAGGSEIPEADEAECRNATHILTLGPAAILDAKLIVQSIVDASTAPGKRPSFRRLIETGLSSDQSELKKQLDENPGLWIRLHPNVRSYVLPDLLA